MNGYFGSRLFKITSVVIPVLLAVLLGCILFNMFGPRHVDEQIEYGESSEKEVIYQNEEQTLGEAVIPTQTCLVIDGSASGYRSVYDDNLLDYITNALLRFENQSHTIRVDAYYTGANTGSSVVEGYASTFSFLDVDSKLPEAMAMFKSMFRNNCGDLEYKVLFNTGLDVLLKNADPAARKIMVVVLRSDNPKMLGTTSGEEICRILEENNIELYVLGIKDVLFDNTNDYMSISNILGNKTETNVYTDIAVPEVESALVEIFEKETYRKLDKANDDEIKVVLPDVGSGKEITAVDLRVYSTGSFKYELMKKNAEGGWTVIDSSASTQASAVISTENTALNGADALEYRVVLSGLEKNQPIYYAVDYKFSDKVLVSDDPVAVVTTTERSFFQELSVKSGLPVEAIAYVLAAVLLVVFAAQTICYFIIRKKYNSLV